VILLLLALSTFIAGIHLGWRLCLVGGVFGRGPRGGDLPGRVRLDFAHHRALGFSDCFLMETLCRQSGWLMNGKIPMEGKLHPGTELAIARTVLANDRTLLAMLRTALGCLIGGASLLKFFGHPGYEIAGIILMVISAVIPIVGIRRYRTIKKLIGAIDPEDWQALEAMVENIRKS